MTAETIIQSLASGLLMGLLYGLIAVGLALIFGLMDVVNFAHGEFLMIAMYATFFLFAFFAIDPLLSAPLVAAALFVFGAVVYLLIVRFAVRAKANAGMVQIFSTFGLAIAMTCISALLGKLLSSVGQEAAFNVRLESSFPGKSESCFLPTKPLAFLKMKQMRLAALSTA
jgi:branched-subunit amino acid ABC-type transport system permease component